MLEFPVNLNDEITINENVEKYLKSLKAIIFETNSILSKSYNFYQIALEIQKVVKIER